jgi:hypothetical protein
VTVQVQIPYISFTANGTQLIFTFSYGFVESLDVDVEVDSVEQIEFSDYTLTYTNNYDGGTITFTTAPVAGAIVEIIRMTTKSQNVDYESFTSFPADTHEWNLDKITYILQELIDGVTEGGLSFDLSTQQDEFSVTVLNSGGTDALLPLWTTAALAGVYSATVDIAANIPADGSASSKEEGHIFIGI